MAQEAQRRAAEDILDRLEQLIQAQSSDSSSLIDKSSTDTISVAILDTGTITTRVLGSPHSPHSPQTLFQAASISKSVTSIAVTKLCQLGTLKLDAPISRYLSREQISWISAPKTVKLAENITLRQLLSHTSGLSCHGFAGYASGPLPSIEQILKAEPPANNEAVKVSMMPGTKYSYSGGGYTVIQLILETVLQKSFSEIMYDVVLNPLGMSRSTFKILSAESEEKDLAQAYWNGKLKCNPGHHAQPESAAAGLWTTPSDLLRAVHAVQRSLASDDFLEQDRAGVMLTEVEENGMALGWRVKKGGNNFQHIGGNDPGWRCVVVGYAELGDGKEDDKEGKVEVPKDCGICIMTNSALGDVVHDQIAAAVAYLKGWPSVADGPVAVPFIDHSRVVDDRAREWVGKWGPGAWEIKYENRSFTVSHWTTPSFTLLPGAVPAHRYEDGRSIDLVADGLALMLRLGWEGGERAVEVWQDGDIIILKRERLPQ